VAVGCSIFWPLSQSLELVVAFTGVGRSYNDSFAFNASRNTRSERATTNNLICLARRFIGWNGKDCAECDYIFKLLAQIRVHSAK